jgi:hypothetical protein
LTSDVYHGNETAGFTPVATVRAGDIREHSIFGTSATDVFVVDGESGSVSHFDGTAWTPGYAFTDQTVYGGYAWTGTASTPGEAWLAGTRGRIWRLSNGTLSMTVPVIAKASTYDLKSVWSDGSDVYAVGNGLFRLNATGESDVWTSVAGTETRFINGIWGSSAADI